MTDSVYRPTAEQDAIIHHDGHAFVHACPGAGKTRTMVERARQLLSNPTDRRGVAFLSFTNAAVEELGTRLRSFGMLPTPFFPSFIGTFDRFLWLFLVAPFGVDGCSRSPRLVPDKSEWEIKPYADARALRLKDFDRATGALLPKTAETWVAPKNGAAPWEAVARRAIAGAMAEGLLDFEDVRECVGRRLADPVFSVRLGGALAARFKEAVVDEAQDCNPADLKVIDWLRASGIKVKIVCDPNQAIYAFRGGVTDELLSFAKTFDSLDQLPMSGNFRSSPAICAAISQLRPPASRVAADIPRGRHKGETTPVHVLAYAGSGVPATIGERFQALAATLGIAAGQARVLAATWASAGNAVGRATPAPGNDRTLLLAEAVVQFHFAFEAGTRKDALWRLHRAILLLRGEIASVGEYFRHVSANGLDDGQWRPAVIELAQALRPRSGEGAAGWLKRARALLNSDLVGSSSIAQRLRPNTKLDAILAEPLPTSLPAQAIHSVKGLEFPAVCVVLTSTVAGRILAVLTGAATDAKDVEEARKIYVAASRAERLLAIAVPKSRAAALKAVLDAGGHPACVSAL